MIQFDGMRLKAGEFKRNTKGEMSGNSDKVQEEHLLPTLDE